MALICTRALAGRIRMARKYSMEFDRKIKLNEHSIFLYYIILCRPQYVYGMLLNPLLPYIHMFIYKKTHTIHYVFKCR